MIRSQVPLIEKFVRLSPEEAVGSAAAVSGILTLQFQPQILMPSREAMETIYSFLRPGQGLNLQPTSVREAGARVYHLHLSKKL